MITALFFIISCGSSGSASLDSEDDDAVVGSLALSVNSASITADGISSTAVTVIVTDTTGSLMPQNTSVIFTTTLGTFSNGGTTQTVATTDDTGSFTVSLISSTTSGSAQVTAISGSVSQAIDVTFTDVDLVVESVGIRVFPAELSADGSSQSQVVATVKTTDNQAVSEVNVVFTTTSGLITSPHTTDENGQATAMITSDRWNREGTNKLVVTGTCQGVSGSATMSFTGIDIAMTAEPSNLLPFVSTDALTGHPLSTISMTFTDGAGSVIADEEISLTTDRGIFTDVDANPLSQSEQVTTNADGEAVIYLKSDTSGTATITATARNAIGETSVIFLAYDLRFVDGDGLSDVITFSENQSLVFELLENGSPFASSHKINFSTTLGTLSSYQEMTDSSGQVVTTLSPGEQSGVAVVDATATIDLPDPEEDVLLTAQTKVVIGAEDAQKIILSMYPGVIDVDTGISTIRAEVYDGDDNPVPSQNVYFGISNGPGGGEYLSVSVKQTDSTGGAEIQFYAGALASDTVEIKASLESDFTGVVNFIPLTIAGPVANIGVSINLESVIQPDLEQGFLEVGVSAVVTDINGNPVADGTAVMFGVESIEFDEDRDDDGTIHCWGADGMSSYINASCVDGTCSCADGTTLPYDDETSYCDKLECSLGLTRLGTDWFSDDVNQNGYLDMASTEDTNGNSILDTGEDINENGVIDPIQGSSILSPILTEDGVASTTMKYLMAHAENIKVRITAQAKNKSNFYETTLLCTETMVTNGTCGVGY